MDKRGFTIMEIIVVVVMLGILAGICIPKITGPNEEIISNEGRETLITLLGSQKRYALENGGVYAGTAGGTTDLSALDVAIPTSRYFNNPKIYSGSSAKVADVVRSTYTLAISDDEAGGTSGIITCSGGAMCATIKCNKGGGGNQCNQ